MNGARILPLGQLVIKNKNDSQIAIVFIFADIFLSNSRIGSKALLNAHRLDSILGEQMSKVHHVVKEAEEQCWPWEIKHPVPFEKQTDQNIVQIQDDH